MATPSGSYIRPPGPDVAKRAFVEGPIPIRDPALANMFSFGPMTAAGTVVTDKSSKEYTAYFSGVNLLSSTIACLPFKLQWDDKSGSHENVDENPFKNPNPNMTEFQFFEYLIQCMVHRGNAYILIIRDKYDRVTALWPLPPTQVKPYLNAKGEKEYKFQKAQKGEKSQTFYDDEIVHIPGMGFDGLVGLAILTQAREAIGLGLSTESFGATFFGNGAVPSGVITHPTELQTQGKQQLEEDVNERLQGPKKSRRIIVLDEGMKYTQVGVSPEDGQFLQTRRFQVREICRWLRIPPHMLYDLDEMTGANIEHQSIGFTTYSLLPWMTRIIQCCNQKLLPQRGTYKKYYYWYDTSPLLLMDQGTRLENYARGRNMGLYTLNYILGKEKMALLPPDQGDTYLIASTMRVYKKDEPPMPIDPDVITKTMEFLFKIPDMKKVEVEAVILGAMPSAGDTFTKSLVDTYYNYQEKNDPSIVPLVKASDENIDSEAKPVAA